MNEKHIWQATLTRLKAKCKQSTIPFSLTINDVLAIDQPVKCEYTGLVLSREANTGGNLSTPTLLAVDSNRGYVAGNVKIVSNLAATLINALDQQQIEHLFGVLASNIAANKSMTDLNKMFAVLEDVYGKRVQAIVAAKKTVTT